MRSSFRLALFVLMLTVQACSPAPQSATYTNPNADEYVEFHPIIDEYVRQKYAWTPDDYHVEFQEREGDALVFWVIHSDDGKIKDCIGGCGKSFAVLLDPNAGRVTKELAFQ